MTSTYVKLLAVPTLLVVVASSNPHPAVHATTFEGPTMGTTYRVVVGELRGAAEPSALRVEIEQILAAVDRRMSTYRRDSEVSRFNRTPSTEWFRVSEDTRTVIDEALRVAELTAGAFDVTAAPLVELWGFGARLHAPTIPSESAIDDAMRGVGWHRLETRSTRPAIRKHDSRVAIDLSGIAKGFAVDALAEHLAGHGIASFLVEIGGEVRTAGSSPAGGRWRVAIERPDREPGAAQALLALEDMAVATSGDYRSFFTHNGVRYSHVIDPRNGRPVSHELVAVTVADRSAMHADALATALLVLGPSDGRRLAERLGLPALFITKNGTRFSHFATPAFEVLSGTERRST